MKMTRHWLIWCFGDNKWQSITWRLQRRHMSVTTFKITSYSVVFSIVLFRQSKKETSKLRITGPLWWIPVTKCQLCGKRFHAMTGTWNNDNKDRWHIFGYQGPRRCYFLVCLLPQRYITLYTTRLYVINVAGSLCSCYGPLARYAKLRVRMRRECRERFPRHRR